MYARVRKSKDGTSKMVWHAEPGDLSYSGTHNDGKRTTFSSGGKRHFTARNIHEDEAFWLAAILPCIGGACIVWIAMSGSPQEPHVAPLFMLSMFGVALLASGIREEASTWKEMLFLVATVALFASGEDPGARLFAIVTYSLLLIRYACLWKERAVWEPFMALALFCSALLAHRIGILPHLIASVVFTGIMAYSFVGLVSVLTSGWRYTRGYNRISE